MTTPFVKITIESFSLLLMKNFESSFNPIDYFFISERNFYAKAITELKDCFNFDDEVYGLFPMILKPKNARQLSPKSLSSFFYDTLYCAISSMKVMLRVSGERTSICRMIISMFRRILNTTAWIQNFIGTEFLPLNLLLESPNSLI